MLNYICFFVAKIMYKLELLENCAPACFNN